MNNSNQFEDEHLLRKQMISEISNELWEFNTNGELEYEHLFIAYIAIEHGSVVNGSKHIGTKKILYPDF